MIKLHDMGYDDIIIGHVSSFKRKISLDDVKTFADLTGDRNPLHLDEEYANKTIFKSRIIHGMLAASLFSTLLGMLCPGKRNLYLSQTLNFRKPIVPGSEVLVKGTIKQKIESLKTVIITTEIYDGSALAISGEAVVKIMDLPNR